MIKLKQWSIAIVIWIIGFSLKDYVFEPTDNTWLMLYGYIVGLLAGSISGMIRLK